MAINPLVIYVGLSVATVGGLVVVQQQKNTAKHTIAAQQEPVAKQNIPNPLPSPVVAPKKPAKEKAKKVASLPPAKFTPAPKAPNAKVPVLKVEPQAKATPAPKAKKPTKLAEPRFDMVRVEQDGGAVIAGRAAPSAQVDLKLDGKIIGRTKANKQGDWVFIPSQLIPSGSHEIVVVATSENKKPVRSKQTIIIAMTKGKTGKPLVVIANPNAATKVVQKPQVKIAAAKVPVVKAPVVDVPEVKTLEVKTLEVKKRVEAPVVKVIPPKAVEPKVVAQKVKKIVEAAVPKPVVKKPVKQIKSVPPKLAFGTVDYNDTGAIVFSGTASVGKTVRLYVDNKFVGQGIAGANGNWVFSGKENIAPGTHELRADLINKDGKVAKRTAVPFVRAEPKKVASLLKSRAQQEVQEPVKTKIIAPATKTPVIEKQPTEPVVVPKVAAKETPKEPAPKAKAPEKTTTVEKPKTPEEKPKLVSHVVIQPGNNLWNISRVIYGRGVAYTTIYQANKDQIKNPHRIYPGQIFDTPGTQSTGSINPVVQETSAEAPQN